MVWGGRRGAYSHGVRHVLPGSADVRGVIQRFQIQVISGVGQYREKRIPIAAVVGPVQGVGGRRKVRRIRPADHKAIFIGVVRRPYRTVDDPIAIIISGAADICSAFQSPQVCAHSDVKGIRATVIGLVKTIAGHQAAMGGIHGQVGRIREPGHLHVVMPLVVGQGDGQDVILQRPSVVA
jgi:hypothetical protein